MDPLMNQDGKFFVENLFGTKKTRPNCGKKVHEMTLFNVLCTVGEVALRMKK